MSDNKKRKKEIKIVLLYSFIFIVMYLLSSLFIELTWIRLLSAALSAYFIFQALSAYQADHAAKLSREQTELLLQFLSTETSSGHSLDSAFIAAPLHFAKLYNRKSKFQSGLEQIAAGLQLQIPLHLLIRDFASQLDSQDAKIVLQVLTTMDFGGSDLPEVLHQESKILGDMKRVERQVAAENAQQSMEALLLCLLPFLAMIVLRTAAKAYMADSFESILGQSILAASYLLAIIALILNIHFRADHKGRKHDESLIKLKAFLSRPSILTKAAGRVLEQLPKTYTLRIYQAMRILTSLRDQQATSAQSQSYEAGIDELNVWCQVKLLWLIIACPLSLAAIMTGIPWYLILLIVILLPFAQDQELFSRASRYQNELMHGLPLFVALMNQLIKSGMVVQRALLFTIQEIPQDSALQRELKRLESSLLGGQNAAQVLSEFSSRLDVPEAQSALLLLARQETHGGQEILRQLEQASRDCWSILATAYRRRYELLSQRMFIPMILDMFSIVLMSATPALLMFIT